MREEGRGDLSRVFVFEILAVRQTNLGLSLLYFYSYYKKKIFEKIDDSEDVHHNYIEVFTGTIAAVDDDNNTAVDDNIAAVDDDDSNSAVDDNIAAVEDCCPDSDIHQLDLLNVSNF